MVDEPGLISTNRRAWDRIGERVASPYQSTRVYRNEFDQFCSLLPQGSAVLDLGCGPGVPSARELVDRGFRVTGVDFSESMIKAAKRNVPEADFRRLSFLDMKFVEQFDGVFASYSLLCLDLKAFSATADRVVAALRPGGYLFVALNERAAADGDAGGVSMIMGEEMYTRAYSEAEVVEAYQGRAMKLYRVARDTVVTAEYGVENMLVLLFEREQRLSGSSASPSGG